MFASSERMHSLVILLLFLQSTSAEILTKLSIHYTDVHKIKCDALPYRTVYSDRSCYFVLDSERDVTATAKQCSRIFPGSQFSRPLNVPEKVWDSLFVDETSFLSNSASRGKTKAMCVYENQLPPASTVSPQSTANAGGKAICFRKQISSASNTIGRPNVIDEYHCKMICAERNECLAYSYVNRICSLFGTIDGGNKMSAPSCGVKSGGCTWVKKTVLADCPDDIPQPFIDFYGYAPNPAILAGGGTQISPNNFTFNTKLACISRAIMDTMRPDNSHKVEGSQYSGLRWDAKLGSFMLQKNDVNGREMPALSYYIRSARCWDVSPLRFTDTRSCGGTLPVREFNATGASAGYKFTGPIRRYGINHVCLYPESMIFWLQHTTTHPYHYNMDGFYVTCIGGTWLWHHQWPNPVHASTSNMLAGAVASTCPDGGVWSEWTVTGHCPTTCGSCNTAARKRTCTKECGDCPCTGVSEDVGPCGIARCPFVNSASFTCCRPMVKCANFRTKKNFCGNGTTVQIPKCRTP